MHTLIIGRTGSGKSALAKQIGSSLREKGYTVLAFNPTLEKGYTRRDSFGCAAADFETDDADIFEARVVEEIKNKKTFFAIVDEAHEFFTRSDCKYLWIGTRGRHHGINLIAITQRGALINPTIRSQCASVYVFKCSLTDAKFIADDFGDKELADATKLNKFHYYHLTIDGIDKGKLPGVK